MKAFKQAYRLGNYWALLGQCRPGVCRHREVLRYHLRPHQVLLEAELPEIPLHLNPSPLKAPRVR